MERKRKIPGAATKAEIAVRGCPCDCTCAPYGGGEGCDALLFPVVVKAPAKGADPTDIPVALACRSARRSCFSVFRARAKSEHLPLNTVKISWNFV